MTYRSGDRLCNCTLLQRCGSGAYGEVWLAEDAIGTRVALKILTDRNRYSERELAGLKNYKECNHPNLLKIRYVEITDERICYTMDAADDLNRGQGEYLPDTLANRLARFGRLEGGEISAMLDGLLAGLEELHRRHLVHRDVKPDNILWVNGRPTLADAGLIAPDGQGSLVGTPGFLSPKLMEGRGAPEASDDFYALGKVIYCALTGLPVREYPGLPADLTISVDAGLNRALRESCTHPVQSTAEFRRLLQEKPETDGGGAPRRKVPPIRTFRTGKVIVGVVLLFLLAGVFRMGFGLWSRPKERERRHVPAPVEAMSNAGQEAASEEAEKKPAAAMTEREAKRKEHPESPKKMQTYVPPSAPSAELPAAAPLRTEKPEPVRQKQTPENSNPDSGFQQEIRRQVEEQFREFGFFSDGGRLVPGILRFQPMTGAVICELILRDTANPRLRPVGGALPRRAKTPSLLETALAKLFQVLYPDFDPLVLRQRRQYWRNAPGTDAEKQKLMLTEDPVMQAVVLDEVIRNGVNAILRNGAINPQDVEKLRKLFLLRYGLLEPVNAETIWREELEGKGKPAFF